MARIDELYAQQDALMQRYVAASQGMTRPPPGSRFEAGPLAGRLASGPLPATAPSGAGAITMEGGPTPAGQIVANQGLTSGLKALWPASWWPAQSGTLAPGVNTLAGSEWLAQAYPGLANLAANWGQGGLSGALLGTPAVAASAAPASAVGGGAATAANLAAAAEFGETGAAATSGLFGTGGSAVPTWLSNLVSGGGPGPLSAAVPPASAGVPAVTAESLVAAGYAPNLAAAEASLSPIAQAGALGGIGAGAGATGGGIAGAATAAELAAGSRGIAGNLGAGLTLGALASPLAIAAAWMALPHLKTWIEGPDKPTAQKRWENEALASREAFSDAISRTDSLPDIARAFNTIAGRRYAGPEFLDPGVLGRELQGSLFDRNAGGSAGSINRTLLAAALARAAPAAGPMVRSLGLEVPYTPGQRVWAEGGGGPPRAVTWTGREFLNDPTIGVPGVTQADELRAQAAMLAAAQGL